MINNKETKKLKLKVDDLHKSMINPTLIKIEKDITAKVPEDKIEQFYRVIVAADTMMFSPKSHQNMRLVKDPKSRETPIETVSEGVAGLVWLLNMQANKKLPVEAMIYGGVVVICAVLDFYERAYNLPVTDEVIGKTVQRACEKLFTRMGITPQQLAQAVSQGHDEIQQYKAHQDYFDKKVNVVKSKKAGKK